MTGSPNVARQNQSEEPSKLVRQMTKHLPALRGWDELLAEMEREAEQSEAVPDIRAATLFELGRFCDTYLFNWIHAMQHYQQAFKLNPSDRRALEAARHMYWELGNRELTETLLTLDYKTTTVGGIILARRSSMAARSSSPTEVAATQASYSPAT